MSTSPFGHETANGAGAAPKRRATKSVSAEAKILHAAVGIFGERGFHDATTRMIALSAGVLQPLISYHFGGKEGLWHACAVHVRRHYLENLQAKLAGAEDRDARGRLKIIIDEQIGFAIDRRREFQFTMQYMIRERSPVNRSREVAELGQAISNVYRSVIEAAQREKVIPDGDSAVFEFIMLGALSYPFLVSHRFKGETGKEIWRSDAVDGFYCMVMELFTRPRG